MEKFGVVQDAGHTKTSEKEVKKCPSCGGKLEDTNTTGGVKVCKTCGTKPFESVV